MEMHEKKCHGMHASSLFGIDWFFIICGTILVNYLFGGKTSC